jgi:putative two-component system response regulator
MRSHILLVDDEPKVLRGLERVLLDDVSDWTVNTASGAEEALAKLRQADYDAVVTDVNMPGRDGFALLSEIRGTPRTQDVPVIIVTGSDDDGLKRRALELGAADLLNKPVHPLDLLARLRNVVRLKACQDQLRDRNAELDRKVAERTGELADSRLEIIWRLAKAGEYRDEQTGNHVLRVGCCCRSLAQALGLDGAFVETLFLASPLHDIGKIGIPDSVLRKRGPLDAEEWEVMKRHCTIGAGILRDDSKVARAYVAAYGFRRTGVAERIGNPILKLASTIALTHHESWNGRGYPAGLAGHDIPLASRIVALVDMYDALCSERPYKTALAHDEACRIIGNESGRRFDPAVCAAFEGAAAELNAIRCELADGPDVLAAVEQLS